MKKYIITLVAFGSLFHLNAQQTQIRNIEAFNKIHLSGIATVKYRQSDSLNLTVSADENEIGNVETRIEGSTLVITTKGKFNEGVTIYLQNKQLNQIIASGASSFKSSNVITSDSIDFNVSGSSNVNVSIQCKKTVATVSGAGNLSLAGSTDYLEGVATGASTLKSYNLTTKNASVVSNGASTVKVFVTDKLNANASGASSIKIKGDVKDVIAESTTAASITRVLGDNQQMTKGDTTTFNWNGKKMLIIGDKDSKRKHTYKNSADFDHWSGFSLGVNGLLTPSNGFTMDKKYSYLDLNYSRCINVQLNFFQKNFHIYKNYINLVTGFGIEWRRYMLENKTTLNPDSSFTYGAIDSTNLFKFNKNLFKSTMLQVPFLLEFNTNKNPKKAFHIAMGVIGQFMINSKTKQIFEQNNNDYTKINKDSYNMNPLNFKAHVSVGYSKFTVFSEYNITPLFKSKTGPVLFPFVAGVRLIAF